MKGLEILQGVGLSLPRLLFALGTMRSGAQIIEQLQAIHRRLSACRACPQMMGPVVHGPAIASRMLLVGQAPGPREGSLGRPFAWTAGKTLFRWLEDATGLNEAEVRTRIYFAAVARCFPGKAKGGGDRRPDPTEIERCGRFLAEEVEALRPTLVIPVGTLAIEQILGVKVPLAETVGTVRRARYHGLELDVLPLPHPSGASTWHRAEPGKTLLKKALGLLSLRPELHRSGSPSTRRSSGS